MAEDSCIAPLGATTAAYLQLPGGWFRNNAGWIAGRDQMVLVDTCATEARSRRLLDPLRRHTADQHAPLIAVLTHAHGDHANGAGLVAKSGGTILASPPAATDIAAGPHTYPSMFRCTNWGEITPPPITDTIDDHRQLDLGDQIVDVVRVPGRAHRR